MKPREGYDEGNALGLIMGGGVAMALYHYNVSPLERAKKLYEHFDGACMGIEELVEVLLEHPGSAMTHFPWPTAKVYMMHAMDRYGAEAARYIETNESFERERAKEAPAAPERKDATRCFMTMPIPDAAMTAKQWTTWCDLAERWLDDNEVGTGYSIGVWDTPNGSRHGTLIAGELYELLDPHEPHARMQILRPQDVPEKVQELLREAYDHATKELA